MPKQFKEDDLVVVWVTPKQKKEGRYVRYDVSIGKHVVSIRRVALKKKTVEEVLCTDNQIE